jgi:PLP dependent protein
VGRAADSVELIAVTKTIPVEVIRAAVAAGQMLFGESRQQEAATKIEALPGSLRWHFIGRVQHNKVRKLLPAFEAIHAVDSLRLAACIDELAADLGLFPKVYLQVNLAGEASKGGFDPAHLRSAMETLLRLPRVEILGLMTIPPAGPDAESARPWFVRLRELRDALEREFGVGLPGLSMGMSGDYEVAIEEGATQVRVGSAIFGARHARVPGELG